MSFHSPTGLRRASCVAALGLACFVAAHAADLSSTLSLDDALRLATRQSRLLVARAVQSRSARDMAVAAGQLPDPTLKAGINNLPVDGADRFSIARDFMTMRSVGFSQELTGVEKRKARAARFEREAEAADASRVLAAANVQRDTAMAWLDRFYQERMRDALARQRDELLLAVEAAETAYRGARGSRADVFAARSAVAQMEDRIAQVDRQVASATTQLTRWIGPLASQPLGAPPDTGTVRLSQADLDSSFAHHPDIVVMLKQEDVAKAEADIARTSRHADWTVELMFNQRGSTYSNMVSLNVSMPLQWDRKNRQDREEAAKLSAVEQMRAEREDATRAHVAEARAMLQEWQSNRERMKRYDAGLLPLAGERVNATLAAYRGGGANLSAVLEARRSEIEVRIERLRLEMDTARLWAQLNYLVPVDHDALRP